jgi:hypothetical protein
MKSRSALCSGLSVALLSDALWDGGSGAAPGGRRTASKVFSHSAALLGLLAVPAMAQQMGGPPGAYNYPYGPYGYYGASPQPYGYAPQYGYGQPQQPSPYSPHYAQQQYAQPQYGQPQYGQPQGYAPQEYADAQQGIATEDYGGDAPGYGGQSEAQPLDPEQLEQLVAPIALYPDALLAQVVTAATYPG